MIFRVLIFAAVLLGSAFASPPEEDGYELWLRYRLEPNPERRDEYRRVASRVLAAERPILASAAAELRRALPALCGSPAEEGGAVIIGRAGDHPALAAVLGSERLAAIGAEGYALKTGLWEGRPVLIVAGGDDRGVLYGVFALLRHLQRGLPLEGLDVSDAPRVRERIANHWDNPVRTRSFRDESIERGYAGDSFFNWDELPGRVDPRLRDWARLLAAMNMNGVMINNVNTAKRGLEGWRLLTPAYLPKLAAMAEVLRGYGVRLFVSVNFFSPVLIDHLPTADPLDPAVQAWWRHKADQLYAAIPDFGGFLVKADSEGEPGPMKYGRTHADGANMIAAALRPHGGTLHWRAFVYDRTVGDRVTQAYTTFRPLDGQFAENVFVQIKNGPLDFQVREPVSSLLGAMPHTNQLLELQITQEYTGQDKHVCFLAPMWAEVFAFDTHARGKGSTIAQLVSDRLNPGTRNGVIGVMNTGDSRNWTGHLLAQANTFALGRLAWDPQARPDEIACEWCELTLGRDPQVEKVVTDILLGSWRAFEDYTAPLGLGHLTRRGDHFHPDLANRGDYHGGDRKGVGIDRSVATGTGYAGQYFEPWRSRYESLATTPEELLAFFHHVPFTHRLASGNTFVQEIYDRHFSGLQRARGFLAAWESLEGRIDRARFEHVRMRLRQQVGYAEQWVRAVNGYFQELSGIPDRQGRPLPVPPSDLP